LTIFGTYLFDKAVNQDGFIDAVFHFKTQDTGISNQDICLSGALLNNIEFLGCDSIRLVH